MAKPRNVSVSSVDAGKGEVHVWCVSFTLKGSAPRQQDVERLNREVRKAVEALEFHSTNEVSDGDTE